MADNIVNWKKHLTAFRYWCHAVLPQVYDDSLSYYELLNKVVAYLNQTNQSVNELKDIVSLIIDGDGDLSDIVEQIIQQMIEDGTFIDTIAPDLGYVRPEWFGAKADAVVNGEVNSEATDDRQALQDCINAAKDLQVPMVINGIYMCDGTLTVPSHVRIQGFSNNSAYQPTIRLGPNCSLLFDCSGVYIGLKDFNICPLNRNTYFPGSVAAKFERTDGNLDSLMDGVNIYHTEIGVIPKGRNLEIRNCSFSHNRVGVKYELSTAGSDDQMRGLTIEACRFHGIGEESALNWYENSYGVEIMFTGWANLCITNCIFDQGGIALKGYAPNVLFSNNYIEALKYAPIVWGPTTYTSAINGGVQMFSDNSINGKYTTSSLYPVIPNLFDIKNCENVVISNNVLHRCRLHGIELDGCNDVTIKDNISSNIGTSGSGSGYALCHSVNSYNTVLCNNTSIDATMNLVSGVDSGTRKARGNIGFKYSANNSDPGLCNADQYVASSSGNLGEAIPENILTRVFFVRRVDNETFIQVTRFTGNYSSSSFVMDGTNMRYCKVTNDNIIHMYSMNLTTGVETELTGQVYYYLIAD